MTAPDVPTAAFLACEFSRVLRDWLTDEEIAEVVERNRTAPAGVCASHDFCDANMAMDAAFTATHGRSIIMPSDVEECGADEAQHNADFALWGAAWDIAKATEFAPFAPGDIVKFAAPNYSAEVALRFTVVELRGPRVLVEAVCNARIKPTEVHPLGALTLAKD